METRSEIGDVTKTDFNGFSNIIYLKDEWFYLYSIYYRLLSIGGTVMLYNTSIAKYYWV